LGSVLALFHVFPVVAEAGIAVMGAIDPTDSDALVNVGARAADSAVTCMSTHCVD
jgi:hypothetical protein